MLETPPAAVPDFAALRSCWHPVGYLSDFGDGPRRVRLLGDNVVVWRDSAGEAHALRDLCVHRGTALSLGRVVGDRLMCPYHGWQYGSDGVCKLIPQLEDPTRIPGKARVDAYRCREATGSCGSRWTSRAGTSPTSPSSAPTAGRSSRRARSRGTPTRRASSRTSPTSATSRGSTRASSATPSRPVVPDYTVEIDDHVLRYDVVRPEAPNSDDFPVFGNEVVEAPERRSRYQLHLPYTILLRLGWGGEAGMVYFFASQPVDVDRCIGYVVIGRNYDLEQSPQVLKDFEDTIFEQDRVVVESQRPERVPFDLAAEMHLKFDAVAINYRKAMRDQGLARKERLRCSTSPRRRLAPRGR